MTVLLVAIGAAWGAGAAAPVIVLGRRGTLRARVVEVSPRPVRHTRVDRVAAGARRVGARVGGPAVAVGRDVARRRRARALDAAVARELPVVLDLLGVAVDAGCTPFLAVETAARWGPPNVAAVWAGVGRACALGRAFDQALDDAADAVPRLRPVADALLVSDRFGAPVGPALARLASEERVALRRRAEAHARRVPVRLLFPLVFLVLPAFVLLTVVPGLAAGLAEL